MCYKTPTQLYDNITWVLYSLLISQLQKEFMEHIKWQGKRCGLLFSSMNLALKSWNRLWLPWENPNQPSLVADLIGELGVDNGNCFSCIVSLSCQRTPGSHQPQPGPYPDGSGSSKPQESAYWRVATPWLQVYDLIIIIFLNPSAALLNRLWMDEPSQCCKENIWGSVDVGSAPALPLNQLCTLRNPPWEVSVSLNIIWGT